MFVHFQGLGLSLNQGWFAHFWCEQWFETASGRLIRRTGD